MSQITGIGPLTIKNGALQWAHWRKNSLIVSESGYTLLYSAKLNRSSAGTGKKYIFHWRRTLIIRVWSRSSKGAKYRRRKEGMGPNAINGAKWNTIHIIYWSLAKLTGQVEYNSTKASQNHTIVHSSEVKKANNPQKIKGKTWEKQNSNDTRNPGSTIQQNKGTKRTQNYLA